MSKRLNQENGNNPLGKLTQYLEYKSKLIGCDVKYINEAYTTKTCPVCGHRHKPASRTYYCRSCGNVFVRDEVGSVNILNKYLHGEIRPGAILPTNRIKYRRPVKLRNVVDPLTPGMWLGQACQSVDTIKDEADHAVLPE